MKPLCKKHIMNPSGFCILFSNYTQKKNAIKGVSHRDFLDIIKG